MDERSGAAGQLPPARRLVMDDTEAGKIPWESPDDIPIDFSREPRSVVGRLEALMRVPQVKDAKRRSELAKNTILPPSALRIVSEGHSLYPYLRLFVPQADFDRKAYGVAEKQLAKLIEQAVGLSGRAAETLVNYSDPNRGVRSRITAHHASSSVGKFPETVYHLCQYQFEEDWEAAERKRREPGSHPLNRSRPSGAQDYVWTVADVNKWLDELYEVAGGRSRRGRGRGTGGKGGEVFTKQLELFGRLWRHTTARGMKWIVRIILGDMQVHLMHGRVLKMYHPEAEAALATSTLGEVLHNPDLRPGQKGIKARIRLGTACSPMTCGRWTLTKSSLGASWSNFWIERKMDGERVMVHKIGSEVRIFSRNRIRQELYEEQMKAYVLDKVKAERCVLDGEMVAWSDRGSGFLPFGNNRVVARLHQEKKARDTARGSGGSREEAAADAEPPSESVGLSQTQTQSQRRYGYGDGDDDEEPLDGEDIALAALADKDELDAHMCFLAFDLVYLEDPRFPAVDGDVTDLPLRTRRELLKKVIPQGEGTYLEVHEVRACTAPSPEDRRRIIEEALVEAMRQNDEGIIIKQPESKYTVGKRVDEWVKVKPEYFDGKSDYLDVAIIGAYYGKGHRGGGQGHATLSSGKDKHSEPVASFLVAMPARGWRENGWKDSEGNPTRWTPLCRTGGGLNMFDLRDLRRKLNPHWVKIDKTGPGGSGSGSAGSRGRDNKKLLPAWMREHCQADWTLAIDDVPDFVLDNPRHAVILTIEGSEVMESTSFPTSVYMTDAASQVKMLKPVTIRFPRVYQIPWDKARNNLKPLADCNDEDSLQMYWDHCGGRLYKPKDEGEGGQSGVMLKRRKRGTARGKKTGRVKEFAAGVKGISLAGATVWKDVFRNRRVAVLPGSGLSDVLFPIAGLPPALETDVNGRAKDGFQAAQLLVTKLGGTYEPNLNKEEGGFVVAGGHNERASGQASLGYDVRTLQWLIDCAVEGKPGQPPPPRRAHFWYISPATETLLSRHEDEYGDVHAEPISSPEQLQAILARVGQVLARGTGTALGVQVGRAGGARDQKQRVGQPSKPIDPQAGPVAAHAGAGTAAGSGGAEASGSAIGGMARGTLHPGSSSSRMPPSSSASGAVAAAGTAVVVAPAPVVPAPVLSNADFMGVNKWDADDLAELCDEWSLFRDYGPVPAGHGANSGGHGGSASAAASSAAPASKGRKGRGGAAKHQEAQAAGSKRKRLRKGAAVASDSESDMAESSDSAARAPCAGSGAGAARGSSTAVPHTPEDLDLDVLTGRRPRTIAYADDYPGGVNTRAVSMALMGRVVNAATLAGSRLARHGGRVSPVLDRSVNVVIVDRSGTARLEAIKAEIRALYGISSDGSAGVSASGTSGSGAAGDALSVGSHGSASSSAAGSAPKAKRSRKAAGGSAGTSKPTPSRYAALVPSVTSDDPQAGSLDADVDMAGAGAGASSSGAAGATSHAALPVPIVDASWVDACIKAKAIVPLDGFRL